jgi:uncharacterized protein (TIGR03000 family)
MRTLVRIGLAAVLGAGLIALARPTVAQAPEKKQPAAGTVKSRIKVTLPQDDAELFIEDKATKATGKSREFETPPIEAGKSYEYKFTTKWRPNNYTYITRNKTVTFKAGDEVAVDMTQDDPNDRAEIRYVPTPDDIVAQMVKLAKITKDDVVFEPGCGDARILIASVKGGAKRGVGIDLDQERVDESTANVKAAGLSDKIEIRKGDALDIKDLSDATVVMMYMGNEFNGLMRPILWRDLKVGARVVSHRFTFGDWKPDETKKVTGDDGDEYELHIWTITEEVKKKAGKPAEPKGTEKK